MALSTELLRKLNCDEEPLPKRLKLAENVFRAVDLPIVRKEDLILQWLCKTCTSDANTWLSLQQCLKVDHLDIKVSAKKQLINVIVEKFAHGLEDVCDSTYECCRLLVSNAGMQQYFISDPKELGTLIRSLLVNVHKLYEHTYKDKEQLKEGIDTSLIINSNGLLLVAYNTAISVIESMTQIFKSAHIARDDLRAMFIHDILYPLCAIIDLKRTDSTNRLGAIAHKCVQLIIFGKKYVQNKDYTQNEESPQLINFLDTLAQTTEGKELQNILMTFVFVFRAAIGTFKLDSITLDLIFRKMVESAGIHKREILNAFLKDLNDVTFDFENKINGVTLSDYCCNIMDSILMSDDITCTDYELLTQFCYFNPVIIERKIKDILRKIFLQQELTEYTNLVIAILDASIRLRREEKLVSQILLALRQNTAQITHREMSEFFPCTFKANFTKAVNNITNTQGVAILRTLLFHLNTDCVDVLQSNVTCKNVVIMKATVELLVALFEGLCIFEYTGTLAPHQKFINVLDDLGKILSLLIDKALHLNHNKEIIVILLSAILTWDRAYNALLYYVPEAITRKLTFPISEDHWQQIIQRITNFGEDNCRDSMNSLIIQRFRMSQNSTNETATKMTSLIGGLESAWKSILQNNTNMLILLNDKETAEITYLLLNDMTSNEDNFNLWMETLAKDCVQENRRFIISLLGQLLKQIGNLGTGITKAMAQHLSIKSLIEAEMGNSKKIKSIIMAIKDDLSQNSWIQIENAVMVNLRMYLRILHCLPLMFLKPEIRVITFMITYATSNECNKNEDVASTCNLIFSDILEKPGVDIFQYIEPQLLMDKFLENKTFQKPVEYLLRNDLSQLKALIKSSASNVESMYILLECMANIKSKLNAHQKLELKKAEKKVSKNMLKALPAKLTVVHDVKILNLLLKINISNAKMHADLKNITESTVQFIFSIDDNSKSQKTSDLIQEGLLLAAIVLRSYKEFTISKENLREIWLETIRFPCKYVLLCILEQSGPTELHEQLELLHTYMIDNFSNMTLNVIENISVIWSAILKTDMSAERNKLRLAGINKLLQSIQTVQIPKYCWEYILKLLQTILSAKHLHLSGNIVDTCILLGINSVEEVQISACNDAIILCGILIKTRTSLITDRLPELLLLYRRILTVIVHESKEVNQKCAEDMYRRLGLDIEKLTSSLIKLKKDMVRLSPYLIADLLILFSESSISVSIKASLQNCIGQLISICDQHGIALLSRTLPVSMQQIFKSQLEMFNKFYKFFGKI